MKSIIRQHRSICAAVKIISLLCLLLLNSQKNVSALSYWDAIFEIGFNPQINRTDTKTACRQIERLINFRGAIHERPVFDEAVQAEIREVESRISTLDAGNLYFWLPYADNTEGWRGIGIRGRLDDNHYVLSIVDPEIENWVHFSSKNILQLWGPQGKFGNFGLRAFIRPTLKNRFRFQTEGHLYLDDLNASNMVRIFKQMAKTAEWQVRNGDQPPREFLNDSTLNEPSLRVLYGLARDFPHLWQVINRYFVIEKIISEKVTKSSGPITFDLALRINVNALQKDHPHIGALIGRLRDSLNYKVILTDIHHQPIATMAFSAETYLFSMRFKTHEGRLGILSENASRAKDVGIDLTSLGRQRFYLNQTFKLNIAGLKLNIEALKLDLNYYFDRTTANVTARLHQPPQEIAAEGLLMGFFPVWLIDLFIPSNIEDLTQAFFDTLATGNDGKGFSLTFGSLPQESFAGLLWLSTDAEVMSNGTLKFAFNLKRSMIREEDKLLKDIWEFEKRLWQAFYLDFERIKRNIFCP